MIFPFWAKGLAVGAIAAGIVAWGWAGGKADERKIWKAKEYDQLQAQLVQSESNRIAGRALQLEVDKANAARSAVRAKNESLASGFGLDLDKLRDTFTLATSTPTDDSSASCGDSPAALRVLLEKALRNSQVCSAAAESASDDVRALLGSWPLNSTKEIK